MTTTMRRSKTREEIRDVLEGGPGRLALLDLRDTLALGPEAPMVDRARALVEACHAVGVDANVLVGEADYLPPGHPWARRREPWGGDGKTTRIVQPAGERELESLEVSEPGQKPARTKMFVENEADYASAIAVLRAWRDHAGDIAAHLRAVREVIGGDGLLSVFVSQPIELAFFVLHTEMVMHQLDWPETYAQAMAEVEQTSHTVIDAAADAGADVIMFGGAGTEIFSPPMIERHIVEPSIGYVEHCNERGLFSLMHCCGRNQLYLDRGWFERLRPTIFESFTEAPMGDIASPAEAAHRLPSEVFFKGGLNLDLLRRGTAEQARAAGERAVAEFGDRRFVLAGTCAILCGTPRENLAAAASAAAR